ncbi:MAG: DUF4491 family protein [Anaerolineales bacterium]|nr:DUF4491 family protein [Anaerolineales bacterium]MCS7246622.1 DUF4491 family protein [Anaerolineales bacterium]MDW8160432.1 DUF4491 family protein [Anaerolineales bacterium]MDW8447785.1 DUF4491 family protein [Anaerolineales bacterium]
MDLNLVGPLAAIAAFLGIALGHITVRWLEFRIAHLWVPVLFFLALGIGAEVLSVSMRNVYAKVGCGVSGVLFVWDAVELIRQQRRVRRGHAPANPENPRHRRFLEEPGSRATTRDYLRDETRLELK